MHERRRLSLAGRDWRLPTKAELESIVDFGKVNPAIDEAVFPDARAGHYWSSSAYVGSSGDAWAVNFVGGVSFNYRVDVTSDTKLVRCVTPSEKPTFVTSVQGLRRS